MKPLKPLIAVTSIAILVTAGTMVPVSGSLLSPTIVVDMDPTTMGIQSTLTVTQGTTFTVNLVGEYLGAAGPFDAVFARILFNNAMTLLPVLSPMAPTSPVAGLLAGTAPLVQDGISGALITPGTPLSSGPPEPPLPPFSSATPAAGFRSVGTPFMPDPVLPTPILSMTFTANAPGTSSLLPGAALFGGPAGQPLLAGGDIILNGAPPISTILSFQGQPIFTDNLAGSVTVTAPPSLPESGSTLAMLGLVAAGLAGVRRRK